MLELAIAFAGGVITGVAYHAKLHAPVMRLLAWARKQLGRMGFGPDAGGS